MKSTIISSVGELLYLSTAKEASMNSKPAKKQRSGYQAKMTISGPGVIHVSSSEIIKTDEAKRQIAALGELKRIKVASGTR